MHRLSGRYLSLALLASTVLATFGIDGSLAHASNPSHCQARKNYQAGYGTVVNQQPELNEGYSSYVDTPPLAGLCPGSDSGYNFSSSWTGIFGPGVWIQAGIRRQPGGSCFDLFAQTHDPNGVYGTNNGLYTTFTYDGTCVPTSTLVHNTEEVVTPPGYTHPVFRAVTQGQVHGETVDDPTSGTWGFLSGWSFQIGGEVWNLDSDIPGITSQTNQFQSIQVQDAGGVWHDSCNNIKTAPYDNDPRYHYETINCDNNEVWTNGTAP